MFVKKINLKNYYMFKENRIEFRYPENTQNIVNVLIGENGTGKTKILELIFCYASRGAHSNNYSGKVLFEGKDSTVELLDSNNHVMLNNNIMWSETLNERIYFVKSELLHSLHRGGTGLDAMVDNRVIEINEQFTANSLQLISKAVLEKERALNESNPDVRKAKAIEWFNDYFTETQLKSKLVEIEKLTGNPIFSGVDGQQKFQFNELSSGEKQLYIKVASLFLLEPSNSLILIDEPELSLHPEWQASFIGLLKKIGANNQFILATHSPYMISNLDPKDHLIRLQFDVQKNIQVDYDPEFDERDINTTLGSIMGYSHQIPPRVLKLRKEYREYFDRHQENNDKAIKVKKHLLEYETLKSSFFQELEFLKALRHD